MPSQGRPSTASAERDRTIRAGCPGLRALALIALCACGDNLLPDGLALAAGTDLTLVAHPGDELLFMQPDVLEVVRRGSGVTVVYVAAGDSNDPAASYSGLRSAYGNAAGAMDWRCGWLDIAGHTTQHCRLMTQPVSLVFLAYPYGGAAGDHDDSLLRMWEGSVARVTTIAERTTTYSRDELIETITQIVRETQPDIVRTLEVASTHGDDHSDHMLVGALTLLAIARANNHADVIAYRGDSTAAEPPNQLAPIYDAAFTMLARYEACTTSCGTCGDACTAVDQQHVDWLRRRYAVGIRRAADGRLRAATTRCLNAELALVDCAIAPSWHLDSAGELRADDGRCLAIQPTGELAMTTCLGGVERRVFIDDEGHIWAGIPPAPEANLAYAHLWCLTPIGSTARMQLCGRDRAPTWDIVPRTVTTPRADLAFATTGREVRLGDLTGDRRADLCTIENGLVCAPGNGAGGFEPATRIDSLAAPLAIDPKSLTLGDVDGDQRTDACGRDSQGILCATAAASFAAARWSPSFNDEVARAVTSASLTAIDMNADGSADICGVDLTGVVCAPHGLTLQPIVRSAWPPPTSIVWPADLDGDRQADWCSATELGPACAVEAQHALTTDGAPWGYAHGGMIDVAPATHVTVQLADIDGDGRADLCSTREDRVVCARSQGRAFGPHTTTLAILPNQSVASALWLGDLDGDGRADACVDTGTTIVCAVEP
ncbi:MAG TPA: FG-GAP-like repeat-containing protein [Kofleriaceae bacterium]